MQPHLILRIHIDINLGLGHLSRALAIVRPWKGLGGDASIAISGDERAKQLAEGINPLSGQPLPCPVVYLGESMDAPPTDDLKARGAVALVDQSGANTALINALRPMKVAIMEDDSDAHEVADILFQPYLEGIKWASNPIRTEMGLKLRPYEELRGNCRVLKGSAYIVLPIQTIQMRPRRGARQPLNVKKLLVTFGDTDSMGLVPRAFEVLAKMIDKKSWGGNCTLLAPSGMDEIYGASPNLTVKHTIQDIASNLLEFDAVWCAGDATLSECLCLGIPTTVWSQNELQQRMIADIALEGACINLGMGPEADLSVTQESLADWLGPLGQETRQEQSENGMSLIDGSGATRVAQELYALATG